jgi:hypothetical protein
MFRQISGSGKRLNRRLEVRTRYFVVTTDRKHTHPAIRLIAETARAGVPS